MDEPVIVAGVLLAAGRSRRMGRTKQLLPWPPPDGPGTVVEAAFDCIAHECGRMFVVLDHEAEKIKAALAGREFIPVTGDGGSEMMDSIRAGIRVALDDDPPPTVILLHPADHPQVMVSTVRGLLETWRGEPDRAVMPEHDGRGGHPVVIPASECRSILAFTGEGGLRRYWEAHPDRSQRIPVDDPGSVRDLDRPGDYGTE